MERSMERAAEVFDLDTAGRRSRGPAEARAGERSPADRDPTRSPHSAASMSPPERASHPSPGFGAYHAEAPQRLAGDLTASPEGSGTHALFEQLPGFEGISEAAAGSGSSASRREELSVAGQRLLGSCRDAQRAMEELVANVGQLPARRQSLRTPGGHTRTTVGQERHLRALRGVLNVPALAQGVAQRSIAPLLALREEQHRV